MRGRATLSIREIEESPTRSSSGAPLGGGCEQPAQRTHAADPLQAAAQLGLEDHHEGEQAHDGTGLEDLGEQAELEELAELEAAGVRRRSDKAGKAKP